MTNVSERRTKGGVAAVLSRREPAQRRSRERYERILTVAAQVMAEKGSEAFRMSDIVDRAGIPFGSLYQYFPDKTAIIGTLAERYNLEGRECVRRELEDVASPQALNRALQAIVDGYYQMFMARPVMCDIWQATQADRALQRLDEEDMEVLAGYLVKALQRVAPRHDSRRLMATARLTLHLIAAAVRHAISLEPREGKRVIALFKQFLPDDIVKLRAR